MDSVLENYERTKTEEHKIVMNMPEHLGDYLIDGCHNIKNKEPSKLSPDNRPRVKLAGTKTDLYNPVQCTLRKYEVDDSQGKLSDEHCRSTLPPDISRLPKSKKPMFEPPQVIFPGFDLLPLPHYKWYQERTVDELSFLRNKDLSDSWKNFILSVPLSEIRIIHLPKSRDFRFHNYVVKYMKKDEAVIRPKCRRK